MRRRTILGALLAPLVTAGFLRDVTAQALRPRVLIGWFGFSTNPDVNNSGFREDFTVAMGQLGYEQDRNYAMTEHLADSYAQLAATAATLVAERPDVIVVGSTAAATALKRVTNEIPIISWALTDPVTLGLVRSYARPDSNVTGILSTTEELAGKQFALAVELLGGAPSVGLLVNPGNPGSVAQLGGANAAAAALGLHVAVAEAPSPAEFDRAFAALRQHGAKIVVVIGDAMFVNERASLAASALAASLPTMHNARQHVAAGALMSYGVNLTGNIRRAASFVDRLLRGEKPASLPVELPAVFELAINLKTATRLSVDVPSALLARADEVIE
jgi:putative ABC transport system substrate-binding protein